MINPKFHFWLNVSLSALNLGCFISMPFDFVSPFNLFAAAFCAYGAYKLRQHA